MSAYYGAVRRAGGSAISTQRWAPNRNAVRHNAKISLGPATRFVFLGMMVVAIGLISVSQSARITSFDVAIASLDNEITNLEAQRDALAVENAKITAEASSEEGNQAVGEMVVATASDFVAN